MTVQELKDLLKHVDPDLQVKSSEGIEFTSVSLFYDKMGIVCVEIE